MTIWLMALLDRALLRRDGDRFVLESNIRLYAANQAIDSALKRRFTDWCLQLADPLRVWRSHDLSLIHI